MEALAGFRPLCRIDDIPEGGCKGFPPVAGAFTGLFAVRHEGRICVFVNACPHLGVPLDWVPDRFLSADLSHIVCATHGARFRIVDGSCFHGPCDGARLEAVTTRIEGGTVFVPSDSGL